uniref:Uncharacterized protein n=1 Tax=Anguilla anguilla TaxID=7936 RepID=A0A0E9T1E8_ANGAN
MKICRVAGFLLKFRPIGEYFLATVLRVLHPLGVFFIFLFFFKFFTSCTCYLGVQAWCLPFMLHGMLPP